MESRDINDFITDGILAYGVMLGRFVFRDEMKVVYAISDWLHVGPSDVCMMYQISKAEYGRLLKMSCKEEMPEPPISSEVTDELHDHFLCGESAYCRRNSFTLDDAERTLAVGATPDDLLDDEKNA